MSRDHLRTAAVSALVMSSVALPLVAPVALQYDGGVAPLAVLAGAHFFFLSLAGHLVAGRPTLRRPRVDFSRAEA